MPFKIPKFLIKKIFPPKKAVSTVDTNGDGEADALQIKALNMIQPFTIPENIDLGQFEFNINDFDLSEYGEITIDEVPIDISRENVDADMIQERLSIYLKGEKYTLQDILGGKPGGKLIAKGDTITLLFKLEKEYLERLDEGKHVFRIEVEGIPTIEINFELKEKNINQKFHIDNA